MLYNFTLQKVIWIVAIYFIMFMVDLVFIVLNKFDTTVLFEKWEKDIGDWFEF